MKKIIKLFLKYKHLIMYTIFGILTTVVNLITYFLCYNIIGVVNILSVITSWIFAVVFAFITNKLWVFNSVCFDAKTLVYEISTFFAARLATGIIDVIIMYASVDVLGWNSIFCKLMSNIIVIILNYVATNLIFFRKKKKGDSKNEYYNFREQ